MARDPSKVQGKIREQMKREVKARIDSDKKWSFMRKPENNQFYNQAFLNLTIAERVAQKPKRESQPPPPAAAPLPSQGESYFVSKVMYDSMNLCRCGRRKEGTHLIKCLQKCVIKYSDGQGSTVTGVTPTGERETSAMPHIPRTSNDLFGFYESKYKDLEKSTFYVTPKVHLKHKITDNIYNNIIIG